MEQRIKQQTRSIKIQYLECYLTIKRKHWGYIIICLILNIQIIEDCRKSEENLDEAMKTAVNMAIENNILTEFLKENGSEVRNMLTLEYDEETARRVEREEAMEEGREEGRREGEQARRQLIISCLRKFKSCEVVADILDISVEEVQKIKDNM